jgi:thiosulfate/3-mercaptopyruvate sulfurtransferase
VSGNQLITAEELHELGGNANIRIVDCRFELADPEAGRRSYDDAHIPGAVFLDLNKDLASSQTATSGRHPLPGPATLAKTLGRLGIDQQTRVVVYDANNGAMAARAWWLFRWLGHHEVCLLDGGLAGWSQRFAVCAAEPAVRPRKFKARVHPEIVITSEEIVAAHDVAALNIVDARDAARFRGENEPIDPVAGHIPGARNLPFVESLTAQGGWKSTAELETIWANFLGKNKATPWVAMCGSGVTACHLAVSALQAGYQAPRLYVGSWSEWIADPSRPIATGEGN